jgi:uncharacterized protein (UPF0248 family)
MSKKTEDRSQLVINHAEDVCGNLSSLILNTLKSDFTFVAENKDIPVHRVILAAKRYPIFTHF